MFRISFYVEDKQLAGVLRQVAGAGPKDLQVVPVANLKAKANGELKVTDKASVEGFVQALKASGAAINPASARAAAAKCGGSATSYSYYLRQAIDQGLIKKKGRGNTSTYAWAS
jgi:hypothetical protein